MILSQWRVLNRTLQVSITGGRGYFCAGSHAGSVGQRRDVARTASGSSGKPNHWCDGASLPTAMRRCPPKLYNCFALRTMKRQPLRCSCPACTANTHTSPSRARQPTLPMSTLPRAPRGASCGRHERTWILIGRPRVVGRHSMSASSVPPGESVAPSSLATSASMARLARQSGSWEATGYR